MDLLQAFLASGIICLLGQILYSNTKLGAVRFFMVVISCGAILSALGAMDWMNGFGGGGIAILTIAPGDIFYSSMCSLMGGNVIPLLKILLLLVGCFAAGIIFGITGKAPRKEEAHVGEMGETDNE